MTSFTWLRGSKAHVDPAADHDAIDADLDLFAGFAQARRKRRRWPTRPDKSSVFFLGTTEARTRMPSRAADFRTTPAFAGTAGKRLRGLDCALTVCPTTRRPRPSSLYTFSPREVSLARRCHAHRRTSAKSSPTLSASRSSFPADRLNVQVCCVCQFHHHPIRGCWTWEEHDHPSRVPSSVRGRTARYSGEPT